MFTPNNQTPYPYCLTQFGAWALLEGLADWVKTADNDEMIETLKHEITTLRGWYEMHCGYEGWQDQFDAIEESLLPT